MSPSTAAVVDPTPLASPSRTDGLYFNAIDYTQSGCYSSAWRDSAGANFAGVDVTFRTAVESTGDVSPGKLWVVVEHVGTSYEAPPRAIMTSWSDTSVFAEERTLAIGAPTLLPGRTTLAWTVVFATRDDPHYSVHVVVVPDGLSFDGDVPLRHVVSSVEGLWTRNSVCSPDEGGAAHNE
jgi:hypothetical protein